jgi:hypothetical protein
LEIRDIVENWVIWRDTGDWERLRGTWHADGRMMATWFEGTADEFIARAKRGWEMGSLSQHTLGGFAVQVNGDRAVAQTRVTLSVRGMVEGVECDVACTGRFYDLFSKVGGKWAISMRQLTYEKDRLDPVEPSAQVRLDPALLARFPVGYRHLAYMQTQGGQTVNEHLPGLRGPEVEALYAKGAAWLRPSASTP